jgi:LuxR family maltose regulon positive regulatory protein
MTLTAKVHSLRQQSATIARQRLFTLLAELRPLTLVSAPAGYGKTVLIKSWLDTLDLPHVWLALDARHGEPARFAADLAAMLRPLLPTGTETRSPDILAGLELTDNLLAKLSALPNPTIVVLDGYHTLERSETQALVNRIIQHPPRNLRLVLSTRRDPPLALASLRTHGLLTEVRANALRFTAAETAALLAQMPDAPTDNATVAQLLDATEGWITGMLLAIPHLRDQAEIGAALARLHQGNPHILEYLTVEVLDQASPEVQEFLIKTSILDRLHPALCAALLGAADKGQDYLRILRENNIFVHEVEENTGWVRYEHLFRHGLRVHLQQRCPPADIARLHARASAWFAEAGMIDEALHHAMGADDTPHAVQLVAQRRHDLMNSEEWDTLLRWLRRFDRTTIVQSADLSLTEAWLLLNQGRVQELAPLLARIDQLLTTMETAASAAQLHAETEALRCHYLLVAIQPQTVIAQASATVAALPAAWQAARSLAIFSQAAALQMVGDLAQANTVLNDALVWPQNYPSVFYIRVLAAQCQMLWLAADLPGMLRAARQVLVFSEQLHLTQMQRWGAYYMGSIYYAWNELERAAEVLEPAVRQPIASHTVAYANASCALAATYQAQGRAAEASTVLDAAIDFLRATDRAYLPMLQAFAAELALHQHAVGRAAQLVVQQPAARPDIPAFHFLAPQLVRPKVLLALDQPTARQEATALLETAQIFFAETHNTRFLIETLALLAVAHEADNRRADALATIKVALRLATPGGLVRVFADIGPHLLPLLDALALYEDAPTLVNQIRSAIRAEAQHRTPPSSSQSVAAPREASPPATPPGVINEAASLAEPLTARELDVLAAMAQHLTSREIADLLGISAHTIKHHIGNILGKLQVEDRRQAVARARRLGLLSLSQRR